MTKKGANGKYNTEIVDQICKLIKAGCTDKDAYEAVGISKDTYYAWLRNKSDFSDIIKKAEAERKVSLILKIRSDPSWQSAAWFLERRYREEYAPPARYEISGPDGKPFTLNVISTFMYDGKLNTPKLRGDAAPSNKAIEGSAQV